MGQEGGLTLLATFVAFGIMTACLYFVVLRPILPGEATAEGTGGGGGGGVGNADADRQNNWGVRRARVPQEPREAVNGGSGQSNKEDSNIDRVLAECATSPVHAAPGSRTISRSCGANLLSDGLLAFRHSRAAGYEQSQSQATGGDVASQNRKDRARVLSRLLSLDSGTSDSSSPPHRGSTVVVSVPATEIDCQKLRRILYLFATYYNLLVIVVVNSGTTTSDLDEIKLKIRGSDEEKGRLIAELLPDHRIVAASTAAGRVAFVRQLARVDIVLDFDSEVKTQLSRFGFRVINYKKQPLEKNTSQLGSQLFPSP